jgi:hypothetical protein
VKVEESLTPLLLFSERAFPESSQVDEGVLRYGGPFPVLLNDPSIRGALKRADDLHIERHGRPAIPVPVSASYSRLSVIGDGRYSALDFHPSTPFSETRSVYCSC